MKQIINSFVPLVALLLTIFLFGPSLIYLTNSSEFSVFYRELVIKTLLLAAIPFAVLFPVLLATRMRLRLHRILISLLLSATLLLYIQSNILVWNYGLLDGTGIDWNDHLYEGILDSIVWTLVLLFAIRKPQWIYPRATAIGLLLIGIQTISVYYHYTKLPEVPSFKKYVIDHSTEVEFSRNKNVLIFVLDSFQTDFFQEIINDDPSYKEIFDGFTYYRNSLAGHPFTETSTMNILTGQFYEGQITFEEHNRAAYRQSLPQILRLAGFRVEVYPLIKRAIYYDEKIFSNIIKESPSAKESVNSLNYIFDISLFRLLPTPLKIAVYNDQNWLFKNRQDSLFAWIYTAEKSRSFVPAARKQSAFPEQLANEEPGFRFAQKLTGSGRATVEENVFKYFHFGIPHAPLRINEKLQFERMEVNRQNYLRQSMAALQLMKYVFTGLKKIGAYHNSMIFVIADHGAGAQRQRFVSQTGFPDTPDSRTVSQPMMINALPLFLFKPIGSNGPLKTSNAPVSLSDIPATVFSELGIAASSGGKAISEIGESEKRTRRFISYRFYNSSTDKYSHVQEWIVNGFSWLLSSWQAGEMFESNPVTNVYQLGSPLQFGLKGNGRLYLKKGWVYERNCNWILGKEGVLEIPVERKDADLVLTAYLQPRRMFNDFTAQPVGVIVNGSQLETWAVSVERWYAAWISRDKLQSGILQLALRVPNSGNGSGVCLRTLSLTKRENYKLGTPIEFHRAGGARVFTGRGWYTAKSEYTWTVGKEAALKIPIEPSQSDLILRARAFPYLAEGRIMRQRVNISVNKKLIASHELSQPGDFSAVIPKHLTTSGVLEIVFELPDAVSAEEHGVGDDPAQYGLAFQTLQIDLAS